MSPRLLLLLLLGITPATADAAPSPNLENTPHRFEVTAMHGQPAPQWDLADWRNAAPTPLTGLKGKIVVLDFWAPHCIACLVAVPRKNELAKRFADRDVVFIGVCLKDGGARMDNAIEKHGIAYPVALDRNGLTARRFRVDSFPDYYVIDRQGRLRWGDIDNNDIEKAIEILLAETK